MAEYVRWEMLEVFWEDSHQIHGWVSIEDADVTDDSSLSHRSVSYYLGSTERQMTICQGGKRDEAFVGRPDTQVHGVFTIPRSCIKSVRRLSHEASDA
jgi:hypothetical protein